MIAAAKSANSAKTALSSRKRPFALLASDAARTSSQGGASAVTKSEFVDHIAQKAGLAKTDAGKAVDAVIETIQDTLKRGGEVNFSGFGKFHVTERGAREGVHPRTGEKITIAAAKLPKFTAGSGLKKAVKE
jgi:DNA-binding protein HU-beta